MTTSVAIDRSSLPGSLSPLVVAMAPLDSTYLLLEGGLSRPGFTWRMTAMPDSADVHGTEYVAGVKEQTSLPLRVMVQAATTGDLEAAITALDDALSQFSYPVVQTIDGAAKTWSASPAPWSPEGPVDHAAILAHYEVLTITIPVYPIPGS